MSQPRRKKSPKVVSLRGTALPTPQVNADVVEILEQLLFEARCGNVAGVIYGTITPQGHITTGWEGNASRHNLIAAGAILNHRLINASQPE